MKKYILIIVVGIFICSLNGYSQKGKEITLGVGGALTSVWIMNQNFYGEPEVDYAPKMGYVASFNLGYNITQNISIASELQYSSQGQKYEGKQTIEGTKYDVNRDIDLRYLNVPLMLKYAFGSSNTKFRVMAGPQVGFLLEATQTYTRDGKRLNYGTDLEVPVNLDGEEFIPDAGQIDERFNETDISLLVDIGADIHLSDLFFISPGLRLNYGLTDINADAYQIKDLDGEYSPSHNLWGGFYIGLHYKLDVQGYSQRSF